MTTDGAIELVRQAMLTATRVGAPALVASLIVGVLVGMLQASTQVNEPSVTFVVKLIGVGLAVTLAGPFMVTTLVEYVRLSFSSIAFVVR